ncbi:epithelial splicing regulatory protein 2-like [Haemaphysalis longicornis]
MNFETVDAPPQPSAQETIQPSVPARSQGVRHETLAPLSTGKECLRLQGVPLDGQHETIIEFLGPDARSVVDQGVHIVYTAEGQPSGEAIVQMNSEESASRAVVNCHNRFMMGRKPSRVQAFLCSVDEMKTKLAGAQPVPYPESGARQPQPEDLQDAIKPGDQHPVPTPEPAAVATPPPTFNTLAMSAPTVSPETCSPKKAPLTMVLVSDMPECATEDDIKAFFSGFPGLKADGVYMMHLADHRHMGSAFVAIPCHKDAVAAILGGRRHLINNCVVTLSIADTDMVLRWLRAPSRAHLYNVPAPNPAPGK